MPTYIVLNKDGQSKSYTCKTTHTSQPYVKVNDKFLDLTTNLGTGLQMLVKKNGQTYVPVQTVTTTASRSSEYTETTGYSGVSSSQVEYNETYGSSFNSITKKQQLTTTTYGNTMNIATSNGATKSYSQTTHCYFTQRYYSANAQTVNYSTQASYSSFNVTAVGNKSYYENAGSVPYTYLAQGITYGATDSGSFNITLNARPGGAVAVTPRGYEPIAVTSATGQVSWHTNYQYTKSGIVASPIKMTVKGLSYTRTFTAKKTAANTGKVIYTHNIITMGYTSAKTSSHRSYTYSSYYSKLTTASSNQASNTDWVGVITSLTHNTTSQQDYYTSSTDVAHMSSTTALTVTSSRSSTYETITEG